MRLSSSIVACVFLCATGLRAQFDDIFLPRQAYELMEKGDLKGAEALYTRLAKLGGDSELTGVNGLYSVWEHRGKPEEGRKIFQEHYRKTKNLEFIALCASRLAESSLIHEAEYEIAPLVERMKKGERLTPRVTGTMAFALRRIGNMEAALQAAKLAEEGFRAEGAPQWVSFGDLVASLYEDQGRTLEALNEYEFLMHEAPDQPWLMNNYAYHLAVHNKDMPKALDLIRRSVEMEPNNGHSLDTLGFILLKAGKVEESIDAMVKAWRIHPDIMVVRTHLAQSLARRGSKAKTMQDLLDVLRTEPTPENTEKIDELLLAIGE